MYSTGLDERFVGAQGRKGKTQCGLREDCTVMELLLPPNSNVKILNLQCDGSQRCGLWEAINLRVYILYMEVWLHCTCTATII